jgi:hypothetical protein
MSLFCRYCGTRNFRISHFRRADLLRLLILQYPVRCRECLERDHSFFFDLFSLKSTQMRRRSAPNRTRTS